MHYSANDQLRSLGDKVGFAICIFDDPQLGPHIRLRAGDVGGEVDAVLYHENVVCLVGIDEGMGDRVDGQIKKFFEKLDRVTSLPEAKLNLEVSARNTRRIRQKKRVAEALLNRVKGHITRTSRNHDIILRKIFFCPNWIPSEEMKGIEERELIIDKDVFEYFDEVSKRLDRKFPFFDFMHFLKVRKVDTQKKGASRTKEPAQSSAFSVSRLELKKDKITMYSFSPRVEDIEGYVTVLRVARKYDKEGFQRMIKSTRLKAINEEYLSGNETFPNNIIIALNPDLYEEEGRFYDEGNSTIRLLDEYNSLIIIDGQHRFFSLVTGHKSDRHILVTLVFFRNKTKRKNYVPMVKMFYKINKKQERIDPNLSFFLLASIDPKSEENFWHDVFRKLDAKGLLANRFSFKETTMRRGEQKKSIVSVITYGGVLRLNRTSDRRRIRSEGLDVLYPKTRSQKVDFAFNLLENYFEIVERVLYVQKVNKDELGAREIGALLRLVRHFVMSRKKDLRRLGRTREITGSTDAKDKKAVERIEKVLVCVPFGQAMKLEYPTSNWAAVEGYMLKKIHSRFRAFGNKNLLSKKGLEVYGTQK